MVPKLKILLLKYTFNDTAQRIKKVYEVVHVQGVNMQYCYKKKIRNKCLNELFCCNLNCQMSLSKWYVLTLNQCKNAFLYQQSRLVNWKAVLLDLLLNSNWVTGILIFRSGHCFSFVIGVNLIIF